MKPTIRPGLHSYDWRGKFDGDRKSIKHRGRQNDKKEIENSLNEDFAESKETIMNELEAIENMNLDGMSAHDVWQHLVSKQRQFDQAKQQERDRLSVLAMDEMDTEGAISRDSDKYFGMVHLWGVLFRDTAVDEEKT